MRVLHVISDQNVGGAGVLLCSLLRNFDPTRVESAVAIPRGSALEARLSPLEIPVTELSASPDRPNMHAVRELSCVIRAQKPDLVHTNASMAARVAARLCRVPVIHTRHCCFPPQGALKSPLIARIAGSVNRTLSDHVIATADAAAEDLLRLGIPPERITVIKNGSEELRTPTALELSAARARWGISPDDFVVGICARLVACKDHETFLRAARICLDHTPARRTHFLIVGEGEERTRIERLVRELGLSSHVTLTGFVSDMATVYHLLNLNVNCSVGTETSCLALSEGMSAGVPALVSDYGGNPAMIGESRAGVVFPMRDAARLASLILQICADPALERMMRSAARERYLQCYTARAMAREVEAVYREVLSGRAKAHRN